MRTIIYTKCSTERKKQFKIFTTIVEEDGKRRVEKKAVYKEGEQHIQNMWKNFQRLSETYDSFKLPECRLESEDTISFEYIDEPELESWIRRQVEENNIDDIMNFLIFFYNSLKKNVTNEKFVPGEEFKEVFGVPALPTDLLCTDFANIDFIFGNMMKGKEYYLIDFEWVFDFEVPINYIFFRAILHGYELSKLGNDFIGNIYATLNISQEELKEYLKMEIAFQNFVSEGEIKLSDIYQKLGRGCINIYELGIHQVFYQISGTVKTDSISKNVYSVRIKEMQKTVEVPLPPELKSGKLELLLGDPYSIIKINSVKAVQGNEIREIKALESNADLRVFDDFYFKNITPCFTIELKNYDMIMIDYDILCRNNDRVVCYAMQDIKLSKPYERIKRKIYGCIYRHSD